MRQPVARGLSSVLLVLVLAVCSRDTASGDAPAATTAQHQAADSGATVATPVHMALVTRGNLAVTVSGPGRTDALDVQEVRAHSAGTLQSLPVAIRDRVQGGEDIRAAVSQTRPAAFAGALGVQLVASTAVQLCHAQRTHSS